MFGYFGRLELATNLESQQRRSRATRDELEQRPLLLLREPAHHLPERLDRRVVGEEAVPVDGASLEVVHVDLVLRAGDERLDLPVAEHAQPVEVDDVTQALAEGVGLGADLVVELVVGHEVDVLDPVLVGHRDLGAAGLEVLGLGGADLLGDDGEVEVQVLDVAVLGLVNEVRGVMV